MSLYWGLKKQKTDKKYVVIKHPLRIQGNLQIEGIKFCAGFGVVEENSKALNRILSLPMFRKSQVFTLDILKKVGFKPKEIQMIFGYDIFRHFLDAIGLDYPSLALKVVKESLREPEQPFDDVTVEDLIEKPTEEEDEEDEETEEESDSSDTVLPEEEVTFSRREQGLCLLKNEDGTYCSNKAVHYSKGGMCFGHIKCDPTRKTTTRKKNRRK